MLSCLGKLVDAAVEQGHRGEVGRCAAAHEGRDRSEATVAEPWRASIKRPMHGEKVAGAEEPPVGEGKNGPTEEGDGWFYDTDNITAMSTTRPQVRQGRVREVAVQERAEPARRARMGEDLRNLGDTLVQRCLMRTLAFWGFHKCEGVLEENFRQEEVQGLLRRDPGRAALRYAGNTSPRVGRGCEAVAGDGFAGDFREARAAAGQHAGTELAAYRAWPEDADAPRAWKDQYEGAAEEAAGWYLQA